MDKFLAFMVARKKLLDDAIEYVEGLDLFLDVPVEEVHEYAQEIIDSGRKVKCMRLVIELHREWVSLGRT